MSRLRTLARFLLIGALLFAGDRWLDLPRDVDARAQIVLAAPRIDVLRAELARRIGSTPSERELEVEIARFVAEEILFREALALGLERDDAVVAQRLVRNLRFLGASPESSDAELLREAFALRLERSDLVVRRRLVQRMRLAVMARVRAREIPSSELRALYRRDAASLTRPARLQLRHVFLSSARRAEARLRDARRLHARLVAAPVVWDQAIGLGDPFLHGHLLRSVSQVDLAGDFGESFARQVFALEPGRWSAAIESAYGSHLVRVDSIHPARALSFQQALPRLRATWLAEREQAELRAALARLKRSYRIVRTEAGS